MTDTTPPLRPHSGSVVKSESGALVASCSVVCNPSIGPSMRVKTPSIAPISCKFNCLHPTALRYFVRIQLIDAKDAQSTMGADSTIFVTALTFHATHFARTLFRGVPLTTHSSISLIRRRSPDIIPRGVHLAWQVIPTTSGCSLT